MKTPDGKTMPIGGHWLIVGACQGGQGGSSCLISQHVGNTNMPPAMIFLPTYTPLGGNLAER